MMIGDELKRWREKLGMTQVEFAKRLGVHALTVSKWERDVQRIPGSVDLAIKELEREKK